MPNPNQRLVTIRTPKMAKDFIQIERSNLENAVNDLSPLQAIVYIDLCGNRDGYTLEFSPAYYEAHYGMSKDTARGAFTRLYELGYITLENGRYFFNRVKKNTS